MRKILILASTLLTFILLSFNPEVIFADAPSETDFSLWTLWSTPKFSMFSGNNSVGGIISVLLPYIFGLVGFLLLIYIVLGGYQVLVSRGDPKQMAAGKDKITWSVVGFIVMFSAYWIVQLVGRILGIEQIIQIFG